MSNRLKLSHPRHSGHLRPHEYTSYLSLAILIIITGLILSFYSVEALSPGPQAGSIGLTGTMPGKPPTTGATIDTPTNGQHFSTSPATVSGTCPKGVLVELFKNDIFAGSAICSTDGKYSLQVDLLFGQNILVAKVFDDLNQPGPDSAPVTVFYDILPPQGSSIAPLNFGGTQLILNTNAAFRGVFPGQELTVPISIIGGTPPYAVNVQWGDTTNKIVPRGDNLTFNVTHTYAKAGVYQLTLQATDAQSRTAFLTVAVIVNGQPTASLVSTTSKSTRNILLVLWPLYVCAVAMIISFWLGERREKYLLAGRPPQYHTKD